MKLYDIGFIFDCEVDECKDVNVSSLGFIPHLFFAYFLISLNLILLVSLIKSGFDKLKSYKDERLIWGLIFGLIWGLIWGLIFGLIGGLIFGLIGGLIWGLIWGLIFGLIGGLIWGFILEFEK